MMNKDKIDMNNLGLAIRNTFRKRETNQKTDEIIELIDLMLINGMFKNLWKNYHISAPYSNSIESKYTIVASFFSIA